MTFLLPRCFRSLLVVAGLVVAGLVVTATVAGATDYELVLPSGQVVGTIAVQGRQLTYQEPGGPLFVYSRDPSFDSADRRYLGFYNRSLARVLKFPSDGRGRFVTADLDDPIPHDELSVAQVRPVRGGRFDLPRRPVTPGYGSVGRYTPTFGSPVLPVPPPVFGGANINGPVLGGPVLGGPVIGGPVIGGPLVPPPLVTQTDTNAVPLPDLPPVQVQLVNSGPRPVRVTLIDRVAARDFSAEIEPGQSRPVTLKRDGGQRVTSSQRVDDPFGNVAADQITQNVPPPVRYEMVVAHLRVRSVSIDRTAPGGDVIDEANISEEVIGRFELPPGPAIEPGTIDVYRTAVAVSGPPSLSPATSNATNPVTPLEAAILNAR